MKSIRTPLARVKGLGSAKSGTHHWWLQRVTALALIPLTVWFVISILDVVKRGVSITELFFSPFHSIAMILWIGVGLYHGRLGLQVVIEDYVHCPCQKIAMLLTLRLVSATVAIAGIFTVTVTHIQSWMQ